MRKNRYFVGSEVINHKGKNIVTTVTSPAHENYLVTLGSRYNYDVGYIPIGYEHRPDLISNLFYDTPSLWWLILQVNNLDDPFEGLNTGDRIVIPKL